MKLIQYTLGVWLVALFCSACTSQLAFAIDCAPSVLKSQVEHRICEDENLLQLDAQNNAGYEIARIVLPKVALRSEQKRWITERDRCANKECLEHSISSRTKALLQQLEVKSEKNKTVPSTWATRLPDRGFNCSQSEVPSDVLLTFEANRPIMGFLSFVANCGEKVSDPIPFKAIEASPIPLIQLEDPERGTLTEAYLYIEDRFVVLSFVRKAPDADANWIPNVLILKPVKGVRE